MNRIGCQSHLMTSRDMLAFRRNFWNRKKSNTNVSYSSSALSVCVCLHCRYDSVVRSALRVITVSNWGIIRLQLAFCKLNMPCAAQTNRSRHASLLAANSRLSAKLPVPIGKSYRRNVCRVSASALNAVEKAQAQSKTRPEYIPGRIEDPNYVRIFDTTLRDGEQSPGASMQTSIASLAPLLFCIFR